MSDYFKGIAILTFGEKATVYYISTLTQGKFTLALLGRDFLFTPGKTVA